MGKDEKDEKDEMDNPSFWGRVSQEQPKLRYLPEHVKERVEEKPELCTGLTLADFLPVSGGYGSGCSDFSFYELKRHSKKMRGIHRAAMREINGEITNPLWSKGREILDSLKERLGIRVNNLSKIFQEERQEIYVVCSLLANLYRGCTRNFQTAHDFHREEMMRAKRILENAPGLIMSATGSMHEYHTLEQRLGTLDRNNPEYYSVKMQAVEARDAFHDKYHSISVQNAIKQDIDRLENALDTVNKVLRYGRDFAEELAVRYHRMDMYLARIGTGAVLAFNLMKNMGVLRGLAGNLDDAGEQILSIERKFESQPLVANAYVHLKGLPANLDTEGIVGYTNSQMLSGNIRKLVK